MQPERAMAIAEYVKPNINANVFSGTYNTANIYKITYAA